MAVNNIQFTKLEIPILKYFFKHYKDRYNPRQLARLLGINHANANKLCNILVGKQLLVKEEIGNSAYFSFNYGSSLALKFMEYLLSQEEFPKWLAVVLHSLNRFKPHIQIGLVFGSSIHNKDFQDVDVLLIYAKEKKHEVEKAKEEIRKSQLIEQPIRYVGITEKDALSNKEDTVLYNILANSLVFHNPEKYVEVIRRCHK
jgi:hypothetical protein